MNLYSDRDIKHNNPIFTQDPRTNDDVNLVKSGCKKIISSVDKVKTAISDYISPHCNLDLENGTPIFSRDTVAHGAAPPYQVWLQKVQQLRRHYPHEHLLKF